MKKLFQDSELALWISSQSHYSTWKEEASTSPSTPLRKQQKRVKRATTGFTLFLTLPHMRACVRVCEKGTSTLGLALGFSCSNFLAAASMDVAAPRSSVSAITVGSWGSTHSDPEQEDHQSAR